jgi:List-Bact-rpt repeat protein
VQHCAVSRQMVSNIVATINSAGLALAVGAGSGETTITALGNTNSGAVITGTATLTSCPLGSAGCGGSVNLPQLTVYKVGTGTGSVVSTPAGIDCLSTSTSGAGCTGNFVLGSQVTLTATADPGSIFIGWSANCSPAQPTSPPSGGSCTITMNNNEPVGAIFTLP